MFTRLRSLYNMLGNNAVMLWHACRHPATQPMVKAGAILLTIYILSPIDLIPDVIPVLGLLDDASLFAFGVSALLKFVPERVRSETQAARAQRTGKWKIFRRKS